MSKYSMASKFSFAGTLNLRVCPLGFAEKIPEEWTQSVIIGIPKKRLKNAVISEQSDSSTS